MVAYKKCVITIIINTTQFDSTKFILGVVSLDKEWIKFWEEDMQPADKTKTAPVDFDKELDDLTGDIENCCSGLERNGIT